MDLLHIDVFEFQLGDNLTIEESGETGVVIGRAQYLHAEPTYRLRYCASDGHAIESWWTESALVDNA